MRVYGPRSEDATEATVLTPAAGAPHADDFQVSTLADPTNANVLADVQPWHACGGTAVTADPAAPAASGYKPYLQAPTGRRGRVDCESSRTDIGALSVVLLDRRTSDAATNASRWVTAFLGDGKGVSRLLGLRVEIDESTNGGTSWARFWTGRISAVRLTSRLWYELTIEDGLGDLTTDLFVGMPHASITYASATELLPVGVPLTFGSLTQPTALTGAMSTAGFLFFTASLASITDTSSTQSLNICTKPLDSRLYTTWPSPTGLLAPGYLLAWLKRTDTNATGWFLCQAVQSATPDGGLHYRAAAFVLSELPTDDPRYLALPAASTPIQVRLFWNGRPAADTPFYIADVDPIQLWMDILDGYFGYLWQGDDPSKPATADAGDPVRTFPYDSTAFTALLTTRPNQRYVIDKAWKANDFIEQCICQPLALAYYINASGQVVPVDLSTPTSVAGLGTLGAADVMTSPAPAWEQDRATALVRMDTTYYADRQPTVAEMMNQGDQFPSNSPSVLKSTENLLILEDFGRADLGDRKVEVKGYGFRGIDGEMQGGKDRRLYLQGQIQTWAQHRKKPFGAAAQYITLKCRRTATVTALQPGSLVLVDVDEIPDPYTYLRGGTRLTRVVERSEEGLGISLRLLDCGIAGTASTPTVSAFALGTDTKHAVDITVALNAADDPVTVDTAVTATSVGSAPAATSTLWTLAARMTADGTITVNNLPSNCRIWHRARSEPTTLAIAALPSAWVTNATTYVDTVALTAPSSGSSTVGSTSATLDWTVGDATAYVKVAGTGITTTTLPPGSTTVRLTGLTASTGYTAHVTHLDGVGGESAALDIAFTTDAPGSDPTLPALTSITITIGA